MRCRENNCLAIYILFCNRGSKKIMKIQGLRVRYFEHKNVFTLWNTATYYLTLFNLFSFFFSTITILQSRKAALKGLKFHCEARNIQAIRKKNERKFDVYELSKEFSKVFYAAFFVKKCKREPLLDVFKSRLF